MKNVFNFVDEENVSGHGLRAFILTKDFQLLNVGFALDEGIADPSDEYSVFYSERVLWHISFAISGTTGHGSILHKNTVGEKLSVLLNEAMKFRKQEVDRLENDSNLKLGDVTTVNLTQLRGGVQNNVVPPLMVANFDIRLAIDVDHDEFDKKMRKWCEEAGGGIEIKYLSKGKPSVATQINDGNPFWMAMKGVFDENNMKHKTLVFSAGTDGNYLREIGVPVLCFSPLNHTPVLLHDHDEFIKVDTYLKGIEIYEKIISKIANV